MFDRMEALDHFNLFGLERDAEPETIKAHYLTLAKKWHIDSFAGLDLGPRQEKLDAIFKRIGEAYAVLSDPIKRTEYLTLLERRRAGLSTDVEAVLRAESEVDRGLAELGRRRWSVAEAAFSEAIRLNPDDPLTWAHRAFARYRAAGGDAKAIRAAELELERAFKAQENLPEAYRYLGTIAFEQGRLDRAIRWLERCLEWSPRDVEANRLIRLARGRRDKPQPMSLSQILTKLFKKR